MRHRFKKDIVISLGGSVMCPDNINSRFIREFKRLMHKFIRAGKRFVLVPGGGGICRVYQRVASEIAKVTDEDKDWIGIHATRLNASLIRTVFRDISNPVILDSPEKIKKLGYPITVASGWRPGWSTDYVATSIAVELGMGEIINAGKPAFVYDKNPDEHPDAKPIIELRWEEYRKNSPKKWTPGLHMPIDPIAARLAEEKSIVTIITNGNDLKNFENLLKGEEFKGTIIR